MECFEDSTNVLRRLDEEDASALRAGLRFGDEYWFLEFVLELECPKILELIG